MRPENTLKFYEEEASSYDKKRWLNPAGQYINNVQLEILKEFIINLSHCNSLEIAAGTGRFTKVLLEKGFSVTAIDISSSMLEQLKLKLKNYPNYKHLKTIVCDARNIDLSLSTYDVVICFNALSHISEQKKILTEVYKVLKVGGIFLFNFPNYLSVYLPFGLYVNLRKKSVTRNVYTKWSSFKKIKRDLEEKGFHIDEIKGQLHFPSGSPSLLLPTLKAIDKNLRKGFKAKLCPILFIKARKT